MRTSPDSDYGRPRRRPGLASARVFTVPGRAAVPRSRRRRDPQGRSARGRRHRHRARSNCPTSRCCCRRGAPRAPCRKLSCASRRARDAAAADPPDLEGEEDLTLLCGLASLDTLGTDALDLPPAVSEIERRLVLTMLVQRWSQTMPPRRERYGAPRRSRRGGGRQHAGAGRAPRRRARAPDGHGRDRERAARRARRRWCPTNSPSTGRTRSSSSRSSPSSGRRISTRRGCCRRRRGATAPSSPRPSV